MLSLNRISCCARLDMALVGVSQSVLLTELFDQRGGERLFCWTTERLVGQPVPLCDRDVICILRSQHGRSVWGSLGQVSFQTLKSLS
ncbi:hypothetical protein AV530_000800 [Patagioenas fasciata monilis]|uniref:Uncharacterized protein n=1 Tax=Patagioenas fasciata monilis TaxID=372326 RepID=A0A1V4KS96_PATFA|nr:hypothetical protein AV530_000800 [Patagioenas fasciata monilis]